MNIIKHVGTYVAFNELQPGVLLVKERNSMVRVFREREDEKLCVVLWVMPTLERTMSCGVLMSSSDGTSRIIEANNVSCYALLWCWRLAN